METINKTIIKDSSRTRTKTDRNIKQKIYAIDQKIIPFLWFNGNAEEAMNFYISIFKNSKALEISRYGEFGPGDKGSVMTAIFKIEGQTFYALNAGPEYTFTPSNSFYISCKSHQEIKRLWDKLSENGLVMMELDKYPFSEKYGWIQDKFGISWQLILANEVQKIIPFLTFSGKYQGMAEEAMNLYTSLFKNSEIITVARYSDKDVGQTGKVVHGELKLNGQKFITMDSAIEMQFTFSPAISYFVNCKTQKEVDDFWEKLSDGGSIMKCGWLTDKYGVTWQIVPTILIELMNDSDPIKAGRVVNAMMQMEKIDIKKLKLAYNQH